MSDAPGELLERLRALPAAAALAGEPGVHAVGGAVRDLRLGRVPHELDVVVEGDAPALAHRLGLEVIAVHERFGTVTVGVGDARADLASARREHYPRPGALPEVALGASVVEDLRRRDFTVNAIAVALDDGRVTAEPRAFADLEAGLLRVLHPRSFVDDPTRLLRGVRYAARLGFDYDDATAALAGAAIRDGALGTVAPERLGAELRLLLREPQPGALERLAGDGLGAALLGTDLAPDPELVRRALALTPPDADPGLVVLGALAGRGAEVVDRLRELGLARTDLRALAGPVIGAVLTAADGDGAARRWLEEDRHRRLAITGDDLVAAGLSGPAVGRGLQAARAAMLDGTAPDRDAQLAAALAA